MSVQIRGCMRVCACVSRTGDDWCVCVDVRDVRECVCEEL